MLRPLVVSLMACGVYVAHAEGSVLVVENGGIDSVACGGSADPCRSISQAIRNANHGDTIMVGGGLYGDLNRDGVLGAPGEETGSAACTCVVYVDKRLTILSDDGAATTIIDATRTNRAAVMVVATDVLFGYLEQGFTVLGADDGFGSAILVVEQAHRSMIWGNRTRGGWRGIQVDFAGAVFDNEVTDARGPSGISIVSGQVTGNIVLRNQVGIDLVGGIANDNTIADNADIGIYVRRPSGTSLIGNVLRRNRGAGVYLARHEARAIDVAVIGNRFIGNDFDGYWADAAQHCGIENDSGLLAWAEGNDWVADAGVTNQVACDGPDSTTVTRSGQPPAF